jgi:hypothetical protein
MHMMHTLHSLVRGGNKINEKEKIKAIHLWTLYLL